MFQNPIIWGVVSVLAFAFGYLVRHMIVGKRVGSAEEKTRAELEKARHEASEVILEAKKKAADILEQGQKEERERKHEIDKLNDRVLKKEETLLEESK
ncbi:MAG: Rnase Y domain-containing protein, partial [bacterium]|nr:Rnase Y domain-containing protein [bacterium]